MPPAAGAGLTPRQWWRRATAAVKDKRSLCLALLGPLSPRRCRTGGGGALCLRHHPDLEAAVIKATSHDETRMDYKNAGRVFAWARASPATFLRPIMWALSRRVEKTRSWAVALKALMLAHGVLLCGGPASAALGHLPFDLSSFRDRSSWGLSAFVRAYFNFLDERSLSLSNVREEANEEVAGAEGLRRVERMQDLLELLMQVRPYANEGAEAKLLLETMDCIVVEIFEVYSAVCNGIACSLVGIFGSCSSAPSSSRSFSSLSTPSRLRRCNREEGAMGIRVLRRAAEQSSQLSSYFELCKALGVLNAAELPPVERIPEEDIEDLEALLLLGGCTEEGDSEGPSSRRDPAEAVEKEGKRKRLGTVVTENWVVFEDEPTAAEKLGRSGTTASGGSSSDPPPFVDRQNGRWEPTMYHQSGPEIGCGPGGPPVGWCTEEALWTGILGTLEAWNNFI